MGLLERMLPPRDLLTRLEEVRPTLEQSRRLGAAGWTAFLVSTVQLGLVVFGSQWWHGLSAFGGGGLRRGALIASVLLFVVAVSLINWTRLWVRASNEPFRYTLSIGEFAPLAGTDAVPRLQALGDDLARLLSERITRLSLLDPRYSDVTADRDSHIHVGGSYALRDDDIEIVPWIRLGPKSAAATLAHPVRFTFHDTGLEGDDSRATYTKLLEWVYFTVATRIYVQIRDDVERKIALLPKRYYRAAAYFYEAEDYVRSNTLDAYDAAQELYGEVIALYDPSWSEPPAAAPRRLLSAVGGLHARWSLAWRRWACAVWPRLGRVEIMVARAEIGYARALLDRRALAGLSGQRLNPIFEARPTAQSAIDRLSRLKGLGRDVPGRDAALFDAHVTLAGALAALGSAPDAAERLDLAWRMDPRRAPRDARYMYVRGTVVAHQATQLLQRAVELDPAFEVAQFQLALATERTWRLRPGLEEAVASMAIEEYERVLRLNPGNIAAWASQGYIYWLLGDFDNAERVLLRGREFKDMRRTTFVAAHDYALARIAAEQGRWEDAYRRYVAAVGAHFGEGVSHAPAGYTAPHFEAITETIVRRFERYRDTVKKEWLRLQDDEAAAPLRRIRSSVYAFVLNDYGEACINFFLRSGDMGYLHRAREALVEAMRTLKTRYPMISYNLQRLDRLAWQTVDVDAVDPESLGNDDLLRYDELRWQSPRLDTDHIERVLQHEPRWPDGKLELALSYTLQARAARDLAATYVRAAETCAKRADEIGESGTAQEAPDRFHPPRSEEQVSEERKYAHQPQWEGAPPVPEDDEDELAGQQQSESGFRSLPPLAVTQDGEGSSAIGGLVQAGERLQARSDELNNWAAHLEERAARHPKDLLPHERLWSEGGDLDWRLLDRAGRWWGRFWERELDDLHARALFAWCRVRLSEIAADGGGEDPEAVLVASRLIARGRARMARVRGRAGAPDERSRVLQLLEHIRERFWSDDVDVLSECVAFPRLSPDKQAGYAAVLSRVIRHAFERDPKWSLLRYLREGIVERDEIIQLLEPLLESQRKAPVYRGIPSALYIWVGRHLDELGAEALASTAYARARRCGEADLLLGLAYVLEFVLTVERPPREDEDASTQRWRARRWDQRRRALRRAMLLDPDNDLATLDFYRREIGKAHWNAGNVEAALAWFVKIETDADTTEAWRTALVEQLLGAGGIDSEATYRRLKRWLGRDLTRAQVQGLDAMRRDAASALLPLTRQSYQPLVHRRADPEKEPLPAWPALSIPIAIEADFEFFPREGDMPGPRVSRLIDDEIPRMRAEIEETTGIQVPGVQIVPADLGPGRYRLHLFEVPLVDEIFAPEQMIFVPDPVGLAGGVVAPDPVSGRAGRWLGDRPADLDIDAWDRYTFMLRRLQRVILNRLESLVTLAEVDSLLLEWMLEAWEERSELHAELFPDEQARVRLLRVIRALAAERVPLNDLDPVIRTFAEALPEEDPLTIAERARQPLAAAARILGSAPRVAALPSDLEDAIARWAMEGTGSLALPHDELTQLRRSVRAHLADTPEDTLVVLGPGLRPHVRKLVAEIDPARNVVARAELPELPLLGGAQPGLARIGEARTP